MEARELRIGNWVNLSDEAPVMDEFKGSPCKIRLEDFPFIDEGYYEPIPLSPSILEKAGFVKDNIDGRFYGNGFLPIYHIQNGCYGVVTMPVSMPHLKYLHQLQNLFFSLTGTELNISL